MGIKDAGPGSEGREESVTASPILSWDNWVSLLGSRWFPRLDRAEMQRPGHGGKKKNTALLPGIIR